MLKLLATPLTIGAFVISAITGILMFFHLDIGLNKFVHEWLSWLLVFGVGIHIVINWNRFTKYFSKPVSISIIALCLVLTALSFLSIGNSQKPSFAKIFGALGNSSLETIAEVIKQSPNDLIDKLRKQGLVVTNVQQTVQEIALKNNKHEKHLFSIIF